MPNYPMGFHMTCGTYGARLTGSRKPFVDRWNNEYGKPLPRCDPKRQDAARERMKEDPVSFTLEQREAGEPAIREVAERYGWTIHSIACQADHTHVVRIFDALASAFPAVSRVIPSARDVLYRSRTPLSLRHVR